MRGESILVEAGLVTLRSIVVLLSLAILACQSRANAKPKTPGSLQAAEQALGHYIQLRLQDADWKQYSKFTTWPDEPSWDCRWVANKATQGAAVKRGQEILIPVVYSRLGLYCYDFHFKSEPKPVTVEYELVKRPGGWKVNSPIPDYPDISSDVLTRSLNATANNASETPERRAKAAKSLREIREALKSGTTTLSKPKSGLSYADMNPVHTPRSTFRHVLRFNLMQDKLDQVIATLGKSPVFTSGDVSRLELSPLGPAVKAQPATAGLPTVTPNLEDSRAGNQGYHQPKDWSVHEVGSR